MAMMSPASASSIGRRSRPRNARSLVSRASSITRAVARQRLHRHVDARLTPLCDAAGQHAAEIGIVLERRRQHGEGRVAVAPRAAAHGVRMRSKSALRSCARRVQIGHRPAGAARGVERREIELRRRSASSAAKRSKISLCTSIGRASARSTLLMTTIGRKPLAQRLAGHELGLRHRPFGGIDQHQDAVDHAEDALDLAAEIGMAGRVDDVDAHVAATPPRCIWRGW